MSPSRSILLSLCLALTAPLALAANDEPEPIVVKDPQYGEVLFYFYQDDYFPAIVRLLAAQEREQLDDHAGEAELLLGGMYLSYGHHLEAADIFERLLADNVSLEIRDRTWFFLSKIWYQRGYIDRAEQALGYIEGELPDNIEREARMLQAQILIDSERYDDAIALLSNWKGRTEWSRYAKFNVGVALVRSGRVEEAEAILDELGDIDPYNAELTALRDKANLALGYALLQDGRSYAAKAPLQRVRLAGPSSNKALLGVGWADAEQGNFQRALVPWMELRGRDLLDPAVQESMLAIPYAMAKLDAIGQAADHYLNAIEAFYEEINRIDRTIGLIESGEMFDRFLAENPLDSTGWYWRMDNLPEGPESRYLFHLLASHRFQEGLKNYRDLKYLNDNLDTWQQNVAVYQNMLETQQQKFEQRRPEVEESIANSGLEDMVEQKLAFDATVERIENNHDWLALATEYEYEMWQEIVALEQTPALSANIPEAAEVRDKIALLKGVLQWQLEEAYRERLWRVKRGLRDAGESLVEAQRSRRQIDQTIALEPERFDRLGGRVYGLAPRIESMKMRVEDTLMNQRAFLQEIAVGELQAQKQRLDIYTVQARFALAAIYDVAATAEANP
ncbi:MAG: tetratricopeptide repeat protein [Pseudomonadota bacterium]